MASSSSIQSSPKIKQDDEPQLQPVGSNKNNGRKNSDLPKKRNLVRWDDDLDKQVLLTLQWALNEVGIKIPWDLVAKTMGGGITDGAIVQHLAKLRSKMQKAEIQVPPTLRRGTVAKEPSKIYATSNGKKLPPPVFAAATTPMRATAKTTRTTPKSKLKSKLTSKAKVKRRRSDLEDSEDDDELNEYIDESDEEYGIVKKKARTAKPKPNANAAKSSGKKNNISKIDLGAAAEEINNEILRTLEDGGPASRTRHFKQDISNLDRSHTEEEEVEEEEEDEDEEDEAARRYNTADVSSQVSIKEEESLSPRTSVKKWSDKVPLNMQVEKLSSEVPFNMQAADSGYVGNGNNRIPVYVSPMSQSAIGLNTPQTSRHPSTISLAPSMLNMAVSTSFDSSTEQAMGYSEYVTGAQELANPLNYNIGIQHNNLNHENGNSGFGLHNSGLIFSGSLPSADLEVSLPDSYALGNPFFDEGWGA